MKFDTNPILNCNYSLNGVNLTSHKLIYQCEPPNYIHHNNVYRCETYVRDLTLNPEF